jgi:2,5-diamino-6-(ribosylamino)-4(3H)-pyrimidinone 5'-phosphate reductase
MPGRNVCDGGETTRGIEGVARPFAGPYARGVTKPDYTNLELPPPPDHRPYVLLNMVMSTDGKVVIEGTEQGIGSKVDHRLMREIRVNADIVMNGASTLRASGTSSRLNDEALEVMRRQRGKPTSPIAAVMSRSGDLPLDKMFFRSREFDAIIYAAPEMPAEKVAAIAATGRTVHVLAPTANDILEMLRHMRLELGAEVLLCEGGPDMNAQLFALDVVDEYFVTLGPVVIGGKNTLTAVEGQRAFSREEVRHVELVSAVPNPETSEVYLRYRVRHH